MWFSGNCHFPDSNQSANNWLFSKIWNSIQWFFRYIGPKKVFKLQICGIWATALPTVLQPTSLQCLKWLFQAGLAQRIVTSSHTVVRQFDSAKRFRSHLVAICSNFGISSTLGEFRRETNRGRLGSSSELPNTDAKVHHQTNGWCDSAWAGAAYHPCHFSRWNNHDNNVRYLQNRCTAFIYCDLFNDKIVWGPKTNHCHTCSSAFGSGEDHCTPECSIHCTTAAAAATTCDSSVQSRHWRRRCSNPDHFILRHTEDTAIRDQGNQQRLVCSPRVNILQIVFAT